MKSHEDLVVWQKSIELVSKIYESTKAFPKSELYSLTSQIRRSAVSIPSNIAEGSARNHKKEFVQFLYISQGSLSELETQLVIAVNLSYLTNESLLNLKLTIRHIRSMLSGLIKSLKYSAK